jgi:hypothetical protein
MKNGRQQILIRSGFDIYFTPYFWGMFELFTSVACELPLPLHLTPQKATLYENNVK